MNTLWALCLLTCAALDARAVGTDHGVCVCFDGVEKFWTPPTDVECAEELVR